jgi:hypothetical protein
MLPGNYDLIYFEDFKECFRTYEIIIDSLKEWEFPFQMNDGYVIYYNYKLDEILDIDKYEIRRIMNIKNEMAFR